MRQQYRDNQNVAPSWAHGSEPAGELEPQDKFVEPTTETYLGEGMMNQELLTLYLPTTAGWWNCGFWALPIEHMDPSVPTISRYFGVTSRTINNRLRSLQRFTLEWMEKEKGS